MGDAVGSKATSSPASFLPQATLSLLRTSIFFFAPLHLEASSQAIKTIANSFRYYREMDNV